VISIRVDGAAAVVTTRYTDPEFTFIGHTYEYVFNSDGDRWWLTAVDLVNDDGRWPRL
jgi:hypothetical protein